MHADALGGRVVGEGMAQGVQRTQMLTVRLSGGGDGEVTADGKDRLTEASKVCQFS